MAETQEERRTRPFADFLADHNRGAEHRQAGEALQRLVGAVTDTGKKGSITVTVSVEPMKNNASAMFTTVVVTEKLPKVAPRSAVFYADEDGNLTREDPRQPAFEGMREVGAPELRDPAKPATELREAGGKA